MQILRRHWLALLLWLIVSAVLTYVSWSNVVSRSGWDPDDQLRLVQLRDFLGGQGWFDTTQYRMNPPDGAPMHWSRLIELPLAIIVIVLAPLAGLPVAEMVAGTAVPLLLLGAIAFILGRIATRLASPEAGIVAMLLAFLSPPLLMQLRPMRIDHHGWQILLAVVAFWTMFWPNRKAAGITLGIALAVWLHISLEGAPVTAAFFLLMGWRWVIEKAQGKRLLWTIAAFASASLLLYAVTQLNPMAVYCDSISPPHLASIAVASAIMIPAIMLSPEQRRVRMVAALAAGGAAITAILLIAPECAGGAFGRLDPLVREYWYVHVNEGLPVWHQSLRNAVVLLATALCGIAALVTLYAKSSGQTSKDVRIAGFFLVYATLLSLLVFRTVSVATAFAIPIIAVWISRIFQNYRRSPVPARRIGLVALMLFLLIPGTIAGQLFGFGANLTRSRAGNERTIARAATEKCEAPKSVAALSALPQERFVAPFDMGPTILLTTPHQVLASSHHRNREGMRAHIEIFRSEPDRARKFMVAHGITHIAVCPGEAEMEFYKRKDPAGLWYMLSTGRAPAWLEPLADRGEGIQVWRVR